MNVILHYAPPVINITISNLARTSIFKRFLCRIRNFKTQVLSVNVALVRRSYYTNWVANEQAKMEPGSRIRYTPAR